MSATEAAGFRTADDVPEELRDDLASLVCDREPVQQTGLGPKIEGNAICLDPDHAAMCSPVIISSTS